MAITERTEIGSREVLADGQIQIRTDTVIERDGVEISRSYHRQVVVPGQDVSSQDPSVQRIARVEHTKAVVDAFIAARLSASQG